MPEVLEFNPESSYKLRLTDDGSWAPTEITSGAVHQAKNMQYSVEPQWYGDAPETAEGVTVEPTSDGGWGVFRDGEQIGAMSDDDVKPLDKDAVPSGAPEPKAAPSAAKDDGDQDDKDDGPRRAASIGPDADGDGWVDGKEPLTPGSVDMPPLISGRDIDKALENYDPQMTEDGLRPLGGHDFLPRTTDFEADQQIRGYEESHLRNINRLLDAPEDGFVTGPILHNLSATEDAGERAAEALAEARGELEQLYGGGVGDPQMDARMQEVAGTLSTLTETGESVQHLGMGLARTGDAYNSIARSLGAGVQDALSQIRAYATEHDSWMESGSPAAEPKPAFDFIKAELEEAVSDARDQLEGNVASETMLASATLDPSSGDYDGGRGTPNAGGSTPAAPPAGGEAPAPAPAPAAPQQGGSTPAASSPASSDESNSSKGSGPSREAAERLAGLLSGSSGGAAPQPGGMAPQMPQQAPQLPFPMPNLDPGAAAQAMPAAPVSAPSAGLVETTDPYEALLNPATHLTRDFEAGDMSQIREGNATGRDTAQIRPYTAEARSADSMLTSPPAAGPGAATPRPTALGADMKPLDKDGNGTVDHDAVPATKENQEEVDTAVMIDGEPHDVTMDDPRLLEMMNIIGEEATESEPLEILDAAAEAGIELESFGEMLEDPTEAKAGDAVISTKGNGFYLGKGEVLLETGEVVPLSEVLELRPPQSGIFRLELPELPDDVDHGDDGDDEDQEPEGGADAEPSEGGEAPPAEDAPEGAPAEPAAPAEGGAAPAPDEPAEPEVRPAAGFVAEPLPDPAIAPEFEDVDGDGVPDDNNGNGVPDWDEPLPEPEAPVAEVPAPAPETPEAPAPVEEAPAPAPAPEDEEPEPEQEETPEPLFEGSANLNIDATGLHTSGSATARIEDIPFEGEALGREQR